MRINLGEIIIDKESYFKASLKNPKQMNSEEENNLNKIKEKDLFPTFVKTNFVLDHISHNDFRNFTFEQIKRSLSAIKNNIKTQIANIPPHNLEYFESNIINIKQ